MNTSSNNLSPTEYFEYFCKDYIAVKHFFKEIELQSTIENEMYSLERRVERQEEALMNYERFVEELLRMSEINFPKTKQKQILQTLEALNIEY